MELSINKQELNYITIAIEHYLENQMLPNSSRYNGKDKDVWDKKLDEKYAIIEDLYSKLIVLTK